MMPPTRFAAISGYFALCRQLSDLYSIVYFLCVLTNPVGHIITGVQKTMLLSLTIVLLTLRGTLAAAEDTDPDRRLFVSLTTEALPLDETEPCFPAIAWTLKGLGAMI